ncbi:MAG TPA: hypothetical protein VMJ12_01010 [Candidatus Acidoferrales bacterium]|nr:hypothetical protein [Candidatus Acidoferrales bacterium]
MSSRLRLYDLRLSDLPEAAGFCVGDIPNLARAVNRAELSLLHCKEAGDEGWWGTWAEIQFTASRSSPIVILPREVARLEQIDVCGRTIQVNNPFYEYLRFGNGRLGRAHHHRNCGPTQAYSRNNSVTQVEFGPAPQLLTVYITNPVDAGKRILLQGLDNSNTPIYTKDVLNRVQGVFVTFGFPFSTAPMQFNQLTGVQKDITEGEVQVFQVDPISGAQVLLLTMQPTEQTAWYRRYHLDPLPWNCCHNQPAIPPEQNQVTCTAIAMLEHIDVMVDTDYLLIQEPNAIILEAQAIRMSKNDSDSARAQAREYHLQAVRLLMGQLTRYMGRDSVAIQYRPWGSATLARAGVGRMI